MRCVIVGGGILGLCLARELAENGVQAVVVEQGQCGAQTSSAAAGFLSLSAIGDIPQWGAVEAEFERIALDYYRELQFDRGYDVDYKNNGTVWVDLDGSQEQAFDRLMANDLEPEKSRLGPKDVEEITLGLVRGPWTAGGVHYGSSADIYGPKAAAAVLAECRRLGVEVREGVMVNGLEVRGSRVVGVDTTDGVLKGDTVVVAAGPWTNEVLATAGVWLPMVNMLLWRGRTEPCGADIHLPQVYLPGHQQFFIRELHGGYVWGASGIQSAERLVHARGSVPFAEPAPTEGFQRSQELLQELSAVVPELVRQAATTSVLGAVPTYTADGRNHLGPIDGIDGLHVMTGCNQSGYLHGPGMAKLLTVHLLGGDPPGLDELNPRRAADLANVDDVLMTLFSSETSYFV